MGIEANKALVRRWVEEVWNEGKLELIDELASEQFVLHHTSFPQQTIDRQTYRQLGPWPCR